MPNAKPLNQVELASIQKCKDALFFGTTDIVWKRIEGTLNDSIEKYKCQLNGGRVAVKGVGKIHENSLVILAHIMNFASYERTNLHIAGNGNLSRYCRFEEGSHTCHVCAEVNIPIINTRAFGNRFIWEKGFNGNDETYVVYYTDDKDILEAEKHYLASAGAVAGINNGMITLEVVAPRITKITQIQSGDLNISKISDKIRSIISNFTASVALSLLGNIYSKYERREKLVDAETRASFIAKMGDVPEFSATLQGVASEAVKLAADYDTGDELKETKLKSPSFSGEM